MTDYEIVFCINGIFVMTVLVCVGRVDLFIPGVDTVGGFSMCSSPGLLQREGVVELAVKYSRHPPAHWVHSQVSRTPAQCVK